MDAQRFISERARRLQASGIRRVFDLSANLTDPIDLSIGQPDFDVPAPVKQAAIDAIQSGQNKYTVTQGMKPLQDAIHARLREEFAQDPAVLVTSGVSGGLVLSMLAMLNDGDEAIFPDPYFVSYPQIVKMAGGKPVPIDTYPDFRLHPERIAAAVTPRTKAIILAYPNNPTGTTFTEGELQHAVDVAEKRDLLLVADEIYCDLVYDGPAPSVMRMAPERTLLLRGFSKGHAMTGWRLGYAAGPRAIIEQMTKLQQFTFVCAPSMVQAAGVTAMKTSVAEHVRDYTRKRDLVYELLKDTFELVRPTGGFYVFPRAPKRFENATKFVEAAIARKVLIIPGCVFSERDTHFRVSYAAPDDTIRRGCKILCDLARTGP